MNLGTVALIAGGVLLLSKRQGAPAAGAGSGAVDGSMGGGPGVPSAGGGIDSILGNLLQSVNGLAGGLARSGPTSTAPVTNTPVQTVVHDSALNNVANSAVTITDLYQNVLHRAPDAAGLAYWEGQFGGDVVTQDERAAWMAAALPELQSQAVQ